MVQHDVNVQSGSGQLVVVVPVWVIYTVLRHTGHRTSTALLGCVHYSFTPLHSGGRPRFSPKINSEELVKIR